MSRAALRPALEAGYGLGVLLTVVPLVQVGLASRPWQVNEALWRAGTLGVLSTSLMLPLLGAFVLLGTALLLEDTSVLRVLALVAAGMAVLLAGALALYARDLLQLRAAGIKPLRGPGPVQVGVGYGAVAWVSAWLSVGGYRVWRRQLTLFRRERDAGLIVRDSAAWPRAASPSAGSTPALVVDAPAGADGGAVSPAPRRGRRAGGRP